MQDRPDDAIREYQTAIAHLPEAVPEGALYPIELHIILAELYKDSDNAGCIIRTNWFSCGPAQEYRSRWRGETGVPATALSRRIGFR